jgi:outer membrane protein OmpA-like peptidoglycan-associated protein
LTHQDNAMRPCRSSRSAPAPAPLARRHWLALAAATAFGATGCAGFFGKPALTTEQKSALNTLGFARGDDGWELDLAARVPFAIDASTLSPDVEATLARVAHVLLGVGIDGLTVEGHSDNLGSEDYNQRLSERRAEVVAEALIARGMSRQRTLRRAFGASRPIAPNSTDAGRRLNRRAVLLVPFA